MWPRGSSNPPKAKKRLRYIVWFNQVNAEMYDVTATSREAAVEQARVYWRNQNKYPAVAEVKQIYKDIKEELS